MNPFQQHGAFSWCELMTTDANAAKEFYSQLFGWELKEGPIAGVDYTVIGVGDRDIGGLMQMPANMQGIPPYWGTYVTVNDVDALAQRAEAMGAKILMPPTDIPTVGRFCLF
ncbi:MAG: VOC family protein, partial [Cyanobacteriota bacterium]|nr:VOC family protein [Cyanobacteriota bacterium]